MPTGSVVLAKDATVEPLVFEKFDEQDANMRIDGMLDEDVWSKVQSFDNMVVTNPDTLTDSQLATESRFFYTDKGLYIGVISQQNPDNLVARLSSRDKFIKRDGIEFGLDTSGDGLYGYWFGINLGGTLMDGTMLPERQFSSQWDGPWNAATMQTDGGWTAEMFLPWSMMSMPGSTDVRRMGFYLMRMVSYLDEIWMWPALPRTKSTFLSSMQPLQLTDVNPKKQFTFYPFGASTYNNIKSDSEFKAGFDVYWRPSSNLQLTTTINPDFGNVESDDVVVNLTSFETFFPEKRSFFLEGNEIFVTTPRAEVLNFGGSSSRFRMEPTTLVNTRRIGGAPRSPTLPDGVEIEGIELSKPTELIGAAKVTGQQGRFRYGVLAAVEDDTVFEATRDGTRYRARQDGRDFGVARLLYEDTSSGGRRSLGWIGTRVSHPDEDAEVHGVDLHYLSANKKWLWDLQLMHSDVGETSGDGGFIDLNYIPERGITHKVKFDYLDDSLDITDLGFITRNDVIKGYYSYSRDESDFTRVRSRRLSVSLSQDYNTAGKVVRSGIFTNASFTLLNNSRLFTSLSYFPPRWDDRNSEGSGSYRIDDRWMANIGWFSDSAKKISFKLSASTIGEELDDWSEGAGFGVTLRPNDRFSFSTDVNYTHHNQWLLHWTERQFTSYKAAFWQPQVEMDIFLTAKQQFRITAQWAGIKAFQKKFHELPTGDGDLIEVPIAPGSYNRDFTISRLTFQARYRWEIAPLSDLFIVYTRGANLPSAPQEDFTDLLRDSWTDKIVDVFIIKLRYRLGN